MRAALALLVIIWFFFGSPGQAFSQTTITAHKFKDDNRNGIQDYGEDSLSSWPMAIFAGSGCRSLIGETATDGDGNAVFEVNPGSYSVGERFMSGWQATTGLCQDVDVDQDSVTVSFGNYWTEDEEWK